MIDRYSRPAMKKVWSDENKSELWLKVELAVCEAWTQEGVIPQEDMELLRGAKYNHARMMEILAVVRHETNAFLSSVTEGLGPEGRWLHLGLTSSDKLDTALGLQLGEAGAILLQDMDDAIAALETQAVKHKDTIMMGRTHGVHAEPITFGLKAALWWEEMRVSASAWSWPWTTFGLVRFPEPSAPTPRSRPRLKTGFARSWDWR